MNLELNYCFFSPSPSFLSLLLNKHHHPKPPTNPLSSVSQELSSSTESLDKSFSPVSGPFSFLRRGCLPSPRQQHFLSATKTLNPGTRRCTASSSGPQPSPPMSAPLEPPARAKPASPPAAAGTAHAPATSRAAAAGLAAAPASSERLPLVQRTAGGNRVLGKFACTGLAKIKQKSPGGVGGVPILHPPKKEAARERETLVPPPDGGGRGGTWLMLPISV